MSDVSRAGETFPWKHAVRDLLVLGLALYAWRLHGEAANAGPALRWTTALGAGVLTAVAGYLVHEWGHLTGALATGAAVRLPASPREIFLFNFDVDRNDARQFLCMSLGGFIASAASIVFLLSILPLDTAAGRIALGLVALGVLATAVLELPPFFRVLRGGALPREGIAYVTDETRERSQ